MSLLRAWCHVTGCDSKWGILPKKYMATAFFRNVHFTFNFWERIKNNLPFLFDQSQCFMEKKSTLADSTKCMLAFFPKKTKEHFFVFFRTSGSHSSTILLQLMILPGNIWWSCIAIQVKTIGFYSCRDYTRFYSARKRAWWQKGEKKKGVKMSINWEEYGKIVTLERNRQGVMNTVSWGKIVESWPARGNAVVKSKLTAWN